MSKFEVPDFRGGITRHEWGSQEAIPYSYRHRQLWLKEVLPKDSVDEPDMPPPVLWPVTEEQVDDWIEAELKKKEETQGRKSNGEGS